MKKKNISQKEIKRWWNSKRNKRWDKIYSGSSADANILRERSKLVNSYLDSLKIQRGKILELGFGAGQIALNILQKGHSYHGIDISDNFTQMAKKRCKKFVQDKKAFFKTSSIDDNLIYKSKSFDVVIAVGVFQYLNNPNKILKEINRVLKPNSYFIWAQTNVYRIQTFFKFTSFLVRMYYIFSNHSSEISDSLRSLLFETKIKKFFPKSVKSNLLKKDFINRNYIRMNYKFKKKIFSIWKIKKVCKENNFIIKKYTGAPLLREEGKNLNFFKKINQIFYSFSNIFFFKFFNNFAQNVIILAKRNN